MYLFYKELLFELINILIDDYINECKERKEFGEEFISIKKDLKEFFKNIV